MLKYSFAGDYKLNQYNHILHFAIRFDNPLRFNIDKLVNKIIIGIYKVKDKYEYIQDLENDLDYITNTDIYNKNKSFHNQIKNICIKVNNEIEEELKKKIKSDLFNLYSSDFDAFLMKIKKEIVYLNEPLFDNFELNKFWKVFLKLKNSEIIDFANFLQNRYRLSRARKLISEKDFLLFICEKTQRKVNSKSIDKMNRITLNYLYSITSKSLQIIEQYETNANKQ